ncbi:MAG: phosphorylase [Symploca sp. SIO1A3]|nr:phosphorylase [Symploca sp. SIO1A3]
MPRVVILTALPVEYRAVRTHLIYLEEDIHPLGIIYERGKFITSSQEWEVGIAEVGAGNAGAAVEAERAIAHFQPDILLFVGIAGGIKDAQIGDVVVATDVYGYESGKVGEQFFPRPKVGKSAYALVQRAKSEARKGEWLQRLSSSPVPQPRVFVAPIAAGEKVVASRQSDVFQFLKESYNDAIAVEMEGFGFLSAAFAYPNIQAIVIRGISDLIEGKNDDSIEPEAIRQEKASEHASAFAFQVLTKLPKPQEDSQTLQVDTSIQIDPSETLQSKRAHLRTIEHELSNSQQQTSGNDIQYKEKYAAALRKAIREDLNRLSPLPLRKYGRFIGRKKKIKDIKSVLSDFESHPIIAVDGIGGVGKTAFAREISQHVLEAETFAAIVWESAKPEEFTGTEAQPTFTADVDFDNLLDLIGRKLGYFEVARQKNTEDKRKLVSRILNDSAERYLVVIDNLETVKGYRNLINNLSGMFTRSKAILTTRKKIAEFRHIYSISLRGLDSKESIKFLRSVASERGEAGEIIRLAKEQQLKKVYEATGGLPLAMELVVGQATCSSLDKVLKRLQSVNFQLVKNPESAEDVYSNFFKFIYWDSWGQLSDMARDLLISLGTFDLTEGADLDEIIIVSALEEDQVFSASGELMEYSLIHRDIKDSSMSFFLHPLTHRFVQDDLVSA